MMLFLINKSKLWLPNCFFKYKYLLIYKLYSSSLHFLTYFLYSKLENYIIGIIFICWISHLLRALDSKIWVLLVIYIAHTGKMVTFLFSWTNHFKFYNQVLNPYSQVYFPFLVRQIGLENVIQRWPNNYLQPIPVSCQRNQVLFLWSNFKVLFTLESFKKSSLTGQDQYKTPIFILQEQKREKISYSMLL